MAGGPPLSDGRTTDVAPLGAIGPEPLQRAVPGVVDSAGAVVNDVWVELAVLPVALGGRMASGALAASPADMQAVSAFGAVAVRLFHATTNDPLQLAPGRTAVVTFSTSTGSFDVGAVPAWSFDARQGRWIEEGATTLASDPVTGDLMHRLEVDGGVLPLGEVVTLGLEHVGQSNASAGADGRFSVAARRGSEVELVAAGKVGQRSPGYELRRLRVRTNSDATCVDVGDGASALTSSRRPTASPAAP